MGPPGVRVSLIAHNTHDAGCQGICFLFSVIGVHGLIKSKKYSGSGIVEQKWPLEIDISGMKL